MDLRDLLDLSDTLEKRAAEASDAGVRAHLLEKKALADVAAFGQFKRALLERLPQGLGHGLAFGAGLGLPLLGVGHLLLRDANAQAKDITRDVRNQALLAGMGIKGVEALGKGLKAFGQPNTVESTFEDMLPGGDVYRSVNRTKVSADVDTLAAVVRLDDFLASRLDASQGQDKTAAACFIRNRMVGVELLRSLQP